MGSLSLYRSPLLVAMAVRRIFGETGLPDGVALERVPTSGEDPARCARFGLFPRHVTYSKVVFAFLLLPLLGSCLDIRSPFGGLIIVGVVPPSSVNR
jgi:hypothetical protein